MQSQKMFAQSNYLYLESHYSTPFWGFRDIQMVCTSETGSLDDANLVAIPCERGGVDEYVQSGISSGASSQRWVEN